MNGVVLPPIHQVVPTAHLHSQQPQPLLRGRYLSIGRKIGEGAYGTLLLLCDTTSPSQGSPHRFVALKKMKRPHEEQKELLREIGIMRRLQRQPGVLELLEVIPRPPTTNAYLIMEYAPLDLRHFFNAFWCDHQGEYFVCDDMNNTVSAGDGPPPGAGDGAIVPLGYIRRILRDVVEGCAEMHARGVIHRDLKPENILIFPYGHNAQDPETRLCVDTTRDRPVSQDALCLHIHALHCGHKATCRSHHRYRRLLAMDVSEGGGESPEIAFAREVQSLSKFPQTLAPSAKVGDFGSARVSAVNYSVWGATDSSPNVSSERMHTAGITTANYRSPESLCRSSYSFPSDMWAVGCILYELTAGQHLLPVGTIQGLEDATEWYYLMRTFSAVGFPSRAEFEAFSNAELFPPHCYDLFPRLGAPIGLIGTLREALSYRMTESGYAFLRQLLEYQPQLRLSAEAALEHPFLQV